MFDRVVLHGVMVWQKYENDLRYDDLARYRALATAELRKELKGKMVTLRQAKKKQGFCWCTVRLFLHFLDQV